MIRLLVLLFAFGATAQDSFDHAKHQGKFPLCTSCHAGIVSGADPYPPAASCASCHDGTRARTVQYAGPVREASRLHFDHREHAAKARHSAQTLECRQCHDPGADAFRMNVEALAAETCLECHGETRAHYDQEGNCQLCHVPIDRFAGDVQSEAMPSSHQTADFLMSFGHPLDAENFAADCAVCHARESCERCHRNANELAIVQELPSDTRVVSWLSGKLALYPTPSTHDADWISAHGEAADASCANCHVETSCSDCHVEGAALQLVRSLPSLRKGDQDPTRRTRMGYHDPDWLNAHGSVAALESSSCQSCHAEESCESCHSGELGGGYHGPLFVQRHGAELYAGGQDCSSCHNNEVFCRDCHDGLGLGSGSGTTGNFHDRGPLWLLQHGQAARFELASCASCHAQTDCLRCHSQKGGWAVSPHGPDFAADALSDANLSVCAICHFDDPR